MQTLWGTLTDFNSLSIAVRLLLALIFGGLIGTERGRHGRAAGMRTHILVCLGACMTALVGIFVSDTLHAGEDVTRIAAQVISGIGFLGAGTILIRNQSIITGLTTAAGVWCTATIGIALGYGFYVGALIVTLITIVTATLLTRLEFGKQRLLHFYLELQDAGRATQTIVEIRKAFPTMKHPEITAAKSGLPGSVGLSVVMILDPKTPMETYLSTLADIDNVLFAIEE